MDQMQAIAIYQLGTIIRARHRLWRIDRQEQDVLIATTIDGGQTEQHHLYLGRDFAGNPFEHITREHDYQLVSVAMALASPRVRLALFDDVGLGKTIEAGLIITELLAWQLASRACRSANPQSCANFY